MMKLRWADSRGGASLLSMRVFVFKPFMPKSVDMTRYDPIGSGLKISPYRISLDW